MASLLAGLLEEWLFDNLCVALIEFFSNLRDGPFEFSYLLEETVEDFLIATVRCIFFGIAKTLVEVQVPYDVVFALIDLD
jgi:hypothetical protein